MVEGRKPRPVERADLWSGLMFVAFGAFALWAGADYPQGVPSRIGPGYLPRLLGMLLACIGIGLMFRAWWTTETVDAKVAWRPLLLILAAVVAFALVFEASGLVPAVLATVAIANSAASENKWTTAVVLGAILAFFAWALFVKGLALPLPVWSK